MKRFWKEFFLRGLICAAGGPIVLSIIYGILGATGTLESLAPITVCKATLSITLLAFIAAGMSAVYQMEQLPLSMMILLHGGALYIAYIFTYLLNDWLANQLMPILVFTGIFLVGYAAIWLVIYLVTKANAKKLNKILQEKAS